MSNRQQLRQFLYRDGPLIREFLAQLEGGIFEEESKTTSHEKRSGIGGGAAIGPARLEGRRGNEHGQETTRVVQQTEASEFARLLDTLEASESITLFESDDEESWASLRRGDVVEVEGAIQQEGFSKLFELAKNLTSLAPLMKAAADDEDDLPWLQDLEQMKQLGINRSGTITMFARIADSPAFHFAFDLNADLLLADSERVEGEATIMGKVIRKLRAGERYVPLGGTFKGLEKMLPSKQLDELLAMFDDPSIAALGLTRPVIEPPAAILLPIAIYR